MIKHLNKIYNRSSLKKLLKNLNPTFLLLLIAKEKAGTKGIGRGKGMGIGEWEGRAMGGKYIPS